MLFSKTNKPHKEPEPFDRQVLNRDVKDILQSVQRKRAELAHDFDTNKHVYVAMARRNGSERPESDAYLEYKAKLAELSEQRDHRLTALYQRHRLTYENERHAIRHKFNMKI